MWKRIAAVLFLVCAGVAAQVIPGVTFTQIPLPPGVNPYALGDGKEGRIWFTDSRNTQVGFLRADNSMEVFKLTDTADANNLVRPLEIIEGPDGNGWFTFYITNNSGSPLNRAGVARVTRTGHVTMYPIARGDACRQRGFGGSGPPDCGITVGPDGALWFTQSQGKRVGRITTQGQLTEFDVTNSLLGLDTITTGSDGNLWVTDFFRDRVWRVTPSGAATQIPSCRAPDRITNGPDNNLWMVCFQSIGKMTTAGVFTAPASTGVSATYPVPSPVPGLQAGAVDIESAPDGNLYYALSTFGGTDGAPGPLAIGRINPSTGPDGYALGPQNGRPLAIEIRQTDQTDTVNVVMAATDGTRDLLFDARIPSAPPPVGPKLLVEKFAIHVPTSTDAGVRLGSKVDFLIAIRNVGSVDLHNVEIRDSPGPGLSECKMSCEGEFCKPSELRTLYPKLKPGEQPLPFIGVSCKLDVWGTGSNTAIGHSLDLPEDVTVTVSVRALHERDNNFRIDLSQLRQEE